MASKNALLILSLLTMVVFIPSEVVARDFPEISSNSKAVEDVKETNDMSEVMHVNMPSGGYDGMPGEANTAEESRTNRGLDGLGGVGLGIECRNMCRYMGHYVCC